MPPGVTFPNFLALIGEILADHPRPVLPSSPDESDDGHYGR